MMPGTLDVPIAFLVFNRPELTVEVFTSIRAARPSRLFVIADGPRFPEELEACERTRQIATAVDWECEVQTNFSESNLGCGMRVSSGLNWLFERCDRAIILEDDCVPDPSFFQFCAELLDRYTNDDRVAMISGDNFQSAREDTNSPLESYYFSRYTHIWGWATWRRAWNNYDFKMKDWAAVRATGWPNQVFGQGVQSDLWRSTFEDVSSGTLDTWDFQWQYAAFRHNAYAVVPSVNLISNIGFGESATHTKIVNDLARLNTGSMVFPLEHPDSIEPDLQKDRYTFQRVFLAPFRPIGLRTFVTIRIPAIGRSFRVLRLFARIRNLPLALALTRFQVWPDAKLYDPETGKLFLDTYGVTVWMSKSGMLGESAGRIFPVRSGQDIIHARHSGS